MRSTERAAMISRLARQVLARCDELAAFTEEPGRITRPSYSEPLRALYRRVAGWMEAAGLQAGVDPAGNLVGRRAGARPGSFASPPRSCTVPSPGTDSGMGVRPPAQTVGRAGRLLLGSHLDTVRDAGRYDGMLGVLLGVAAAEALSALDPDLPFDLEVIGFVDEEGLRFGTPFLGSRALSGTLEPELDRTDAQGVTVREAITRFGGDPGRLGQAACAPGTVLAYVEAHIEQGPVLEAEGVPLGVVEAIAGQSRLVLRFRGQAGHAGTTPMALRRDALAGAAAFVVAAEAYARRVPGLVATVGSLTATPGAANVIAGEAALTLDVRHAEDGTRVEAVEELLAQGRRLAIDRGLTLDAETLVESRAVRCEPRLTRELEQAVQEVVGLPVPRLVSGAGHDAMVMAGIAPVALLFLRSPGGVSHHPLEAVVDQDVEMALDALVRLVERLAARQKRLRAR